MGNRAFKPLAEPVLKVEVKAHGICRCCIKGHKVLLKMQDGHQIQLKQDIHMRERPILQVSWSPHSLESNKGVSLACFLLLADGVLMVCPCMSMSVLQHEACQFSEFS